MSTWPKIPEIPEPSSRARPGRRSSLTLARVEQLSDLLSGGNYISTSSKFAGISESTYHAWRLRGEAELDRLESAGVDLSAALGDDLTAKALWWRPAAQNPEWEYLVFAVVMERSRAAGEVRAIHAIQTAAVTDWRAAAWYLEHAHPERYGARRTIALETPAEPLALRSIITVDDLNAKLALLGVPEPDEPSLGREMP